MNTKFYSAITIILIWSIGGCKEQRKPTVEFDDPAFESYCLNACDADKDGKITLTEAADLKIIDIVDKDIHSLNGIEAAVNLEELYCYRARLSTVDLSQNNKLEHFSFEESSLQKIILPDSLAVIPKKAFANCVRLDSVAFPLKLKVIQESAFENSSIVEAMLPDCITEIADYAFWGCKRLKSLYLGQSLESIGECAFEDVKVPIITIPASITFMGKSPFRSENIKEVHFSSPNPPSGAGVLTLSPSLRVYVPNSAVDKYRNKYSWNYDIIRGE